MQKSYPASDKAVYRPDIDGLRALAVLLVLFNHVGLSRFTGGFIGVDIFFVISGYLISGIIFRDMAADGFSFARFYERRFRRIFPAMLVMLFATSVLAYLFLFPLELNSFVQTEVGALASVSNVVLMHQSGYFAPAGKLRPLLHTWSLGVEEQFYLVFPILLLAINRWGRRHLKLILWLLTAVGFAFALYWVGRDSSQAFFLAPLRAWEFLIGILLAAHALPTLDAAWKRNAASACGLLLILWAGMRYTEWTPFPGWHALPPCLGAVLILAAGETGTSAIGHVLSWKPVRFIGLISYSLYLWHWPLQTFQEMDNILVPDHFPQQVHKGAVIVASIAMGALSWRFIETPFRVGRLRARVPLFVLNGALIALLLVFSVGLLHTDGWLPAFAPKPASLQVFNSTFPTTEQSSWHTCYFDPSDFPANFPRSSCLAVDPSPHHYLLVGDSHAAHMLWGLKKVFPEDTFSMAAAAGCAPLYKPSHVDNKKCEAFEDLVFDQYLVQHPVDTVILVGRWSGFTTEHLSKTIDWLRQHGMKVVIVGPAIEFDASLIRLLQLAHREHDPGLIARHRYPGPVAEDRRMALLARDEWHVPYISMYDDLCHLHDLAKEKGANGESVDGCAVYAAPGVPLNWDADHLSPAGSILLARAIRERGQLP